MTDLTFTVNDDAMSRLAAAARWSLENEHGEDPGRYDDVGVIRRYTVATWQTTMGMLAASEVMDDAVREAHDALGSVT